MNLVIGKFPVTKWIFILFPLWAFGLEVWNDCHALGAGFGAWQLKLLITTTFTILVIILHKDQSLAMCFKIHSTKFHRFSISYKCKLEFLLNLKQYKLASYGQNATI